MGKCVYVISYVNGNGSRLLLSQAYTSWEEANKMLNDISTRWKDCEIHQLALIEE